MLLDLLAEAGLEIVGVGKIPDIFLNRGVSRSLSGRNNREALESTVTALADNRPGLIFVNLVDFDMLYGHRLDIEGYGHAIEEVDDFLPQLLKALAPDDLLMLAADHGCDPLGPSTDHSREYVPVLATGLHSQRDVNLGTLATLADVGATIADNFDLSLPHGTSFLPRIAPEAVRDTRPSDEEF